MASVFPRLLLPAILGLAVGCNVQFSTETYSTSSSSADSLVTADKPTPDKGGAYTSLPSAPASAWPSFRGNPMQTGIVGTPLPDELVQRWTFEAGEGIEGAAAIQDGVVYIGSVADYFFAIDLKTGKEKWKYKAAGFKASPLLNGGKVYIGDEDGIFHCLNASDGTKRWTFKTKGEITSSANMAGDNILFGSGDENLYCLSKEGKEVWTFNVPGGPVMASPAIVKDRTFVSGCDSTLHVLNLKNGKELASLELSGQTGSTPAVMDDSLYVGTMTNQFLALDWTKPAQRWSFEAEDRAEPFYSSAAVTDKLVLVGNRDNFLYALERKTGKTAWSYKTSGYVDSSPLVAGKRVYFGSLDRNLYVLDLDKGTLVQKIKLDGRIPGSPAAADGCLVVGTERGTVYCFEGKK